MASDLIHLLSPLVADAGTLSGGSWRSTAPLANIQDSDIRKVARSTSEAEAHTQWRLDGGISPKRTWSMFALLGHSITTAGQWRIVCTDDASDTPANRLYDSGWINAWEPTVTFGSLPWGAFPWSGVDAAAYPNHPLSLHIAPSSIFARYVFIYLSDTGNSAGYVDVGRFLAGEAWSPTTNIAYDFSIRWLDPSEARRTEGARRILRKRKPYRVAEMAFEWLQPREAWGPLFEMQRFGKATELLFVANPNDPPDIRFKRSFFGAIVDTAPITEVAFETLTMRLSLEELV